jgi:probable addiction module antidote protein
MIEVINAAFHSKDVNRIARAIGAAAKAQNFSEVARPAGIARPSLYRAFDREGAYPQHDDRREDIGCYRFGAESLTN